MDLMDLLQWPAMVVTIVAAWLVASSRGGRRNSGFWAFLLSNVLWVVWGLHVGAPALVAMQIGLATMNVRGAIKTTSPPMPVSTPHVNRDQNPSMGLDALSQTIPSLPTPIVSAVAINVLHHTDSIGTDDHTPRNG